MYSKKNILKIVSLGMIGIYLISCGKDDDDLPTIPNEEEFISTVVLTLQPIGGAKALELRFTDLDGDGGNAPIIFADSIPAETDFLASVQFLNESAVPSENITEEIKNEGEEHQVFYQIMDTLNLAVTYADQDVGGNPLGLNTTISSGKVGKGSLKITLRHMPDKNATGVKLGDITNAGGETDVEVTLPLNIYK